MTRRTHTQTGDKIRILVVEDDPRYREAISQMYERILGRNAAEIYPYASGGEALGFLRKGKVDLLSLDINLTAQHPITSAGQPDTDILGYDGRDLLAEAAKFKASRAVIIITGAPQDKVFEWFSQTTGRGSFGTIDQQAELLFPKRWDTCTKDSALPIEENIKRFEIRLTAAKIRELVDAPQTTLPPPYLLDITGDPIAGHKLRLIVRSIEISSKRSKNLKASKPKVGQAEVTNPKDALFLYLAAKGADAGKPTVSKPAVYRIFSDKQVADPRRTAVNEKENKYVDSQIASMKRRLRSARVAIDVDRLIEVDNPGRGWMLCGDVEVRGLESVSGGLSLDEGRAPSHPSAEDDCVAKEELEHENLGDDVDDDRE